MLMYQRGWETAVLHQLKHHPVKRESQRILEAGYLVPSPCLILPSLHFRCCTEMGKMQEVTLTLSWDVLQNITELPEINI